MVIGHGEISEYIWGKKRIRGSSIIMEDNSYNIIMYIVIWRK